MNGRSLQYLFTGSVPAITFDLDHVAIRSVTAVFTAILDPVSDGARTHFMSAFSFVRHISNLALVMVRSRFPALFIDYMKL